MTTYIRKELIKDYELSELDLVLNDEFKTEEESDDDDISLEEIRKDYGEAEGEAVRIDFLISELQELIKLGATHVELENHYGHNGYIVSAYNIRLATETEIEEHENAKKAKSIHYLKHRRTQLLQQLEQIDKEIEP